jgi:hypothetical protein
MAVVPRAKMFMVLEESEAFNRIVLDFLAIHYQTRAPSDAPS